MNNDQTELSISIVNTNNKKLLETCLSSIYDNTKKTRFEIIVVDNCSTDGSVEMVRECYPDVKLICQKSRNGYGFSHNRSWEQSCGEYFLVLNEDMFVFPGALDIMIETIKKDKTIGALGCRLLNPERSLQHSCSNYPTLFSVIYNNLVPYHFMFPDSSMRSKLYYWNHDEERDVDVIMGSCMLIPREVIDVIGLFDERYFIFSEEVDLCKRITQAGWRVHFTPKAEIVHYRGQASKKMSVKMYIILIESQIKYFRKHYGDFHVFIVKLAYIFGCTLRIIGWTIMKIFHLKDKQLSNGKIESNLKAFLWCFGLYKP